MLVRIGYGNKLKDDIWLGAMQCPNCGQEADFRLKRVQSYTSIFWVPITSRTIKRTIVCDHCGAGWEKNKEEYKALKKQQEEKLARGEFPDRIVARDYAPARLHKGRKIGLLVGALLVALMFLTMFAAIMGDLRERGIPLDGGSAAVLILLMALGVLPLIFALHSLVKTSRLQKTYNFYQARYQLQQQRRFQTGNPQGFPGGMQENR